MLINEVLTKVNLVRNDVKLVIGLTVLLCTSSISFSAYGAPNRYWYCTAEGFNYYNASEYVYGDWRLTKSEARVVAIENCSDRPLNRCRVKWCDRDWYDPNSPY